MISLHGYARRGFAQLGSFAFAATIALSGCGDDGDLDTKAAEAGQAAVARWQCASCHEDGSKGTLAGSTTPVAGTEAYGQNLTPDEDTGMGEWSAEQLVNAILTGIDDEDEELCAVMPRFGSLGMTRTEAENIVAYLRSLPAVHNEVPESECASEETAE